MESEYEKLRDEILMWQERRITVLTGSVTALFAFVAYVLSARPDAWSWARAMSVELLVVASACLFHWYAGFGNGVASAYLQAAYEEGTGRGWDRARAELKVRKPLLKYCSMNNVIGLIYIFFLAGSSWIIAGHCTGSEEPADRSAIGVLAVVCLIGLLLVMVPGLASRRQSYLKEFRTIVKQQPSPARPSSP